MRCKFRIFSIGVVPAKEIFAKFRSGQSDDIAAIAKYCARDCVLVSELMARLQTIESMIQMTFICGVAPNEILWGGCQYQVVAVLEAFVAKVALKVAVK